MDRQEAMKLLGLPEGYSRPDLEKAWKVLVKKHHPDVAGGSHELMIRIKAARTVLIETYRQPATFKCMNGTLGCKGIERGAPNDLCGFCKDDLDPFQIRIPNSWIHQPPERRIAPQAMLCRRAGCLFAIEKGEEYVFDPDKGCYHKQCWTHQDYKKM